MTRRRIHTMQWRHPRWCGYLGYLMKERGLTINIAGDYDGKGEYNVRVSVP